MAGDRYFSKVALLLHGDGANNATTFTDSSGTPKTVTGSGNAKISTAQSKFGGSSIYLDGSGDLLTAGIDSNWTALHTSTAKWTIEGWIKPDNWTTRKTLLTTTNGSTANVGIWLSLAENTRKIEMYIYRGVASSFVITGTFSGAFPNDTDWHHFAVTYDYALASANATLWIDGVASGTLSKTGNAPSASAPTVALKIGGYSSTGDFAGYIDDLRVSIGVIRYEATFTPHSAAHPDASTTVAGVIKDDTNANCARTVRFYDRASGALLGEVTSDASTGAYSIVAESDEVQRVVLDDSGGMLYNDLIDRVIPE